ARHGTESQKSCTSPNEQPYVGEMVLCTPLLKNWEKDKRCHYHVTFGLKKRGIMVVWKSERG
ncbi:hypothetical protein, partial [Bacillus thuringiensis]|uniref:hypothetical protein n=1 Tax=Bacillus thuringiensis TaxID=1428 RepID=UPI001C556148